MSDKEDAFIKIDSLYDLKQITDVKIRPNSNEIFYTINQANKEDNSYRQAIWRFREKPIKFTQGLPRDGGMKWSPDGKTLAFVSIRGVIPQKPDSQPPKPQIFLIPFDGGEAEQLTKLSTGVTGNFEWSKDGSKIIFISRMNEEELSEPSEEEKKDLISEEHIIHGTNKKKAEETKIEPRIIKRTEYRAGTSYKDDRKGQIHVIDVETKKVKRWTNSLEDDYTFAYLSNDNTLAYTSRQKPGEGDETRNWELVKIDSEGKTEIVIDDHYGWGFFFELSPNNQYAVSTITNKELGTLAQDQLCLYDLKKKTRKYLANDIDNSKYNLKWSEDNKFVYFIVPNQGIESIWRIEVETEKLEQIVKADRVIAGYDLSKDGNWIAYHARNVNDPSQLYQYQIEDKKDELIDAPNDKFLKKIALGKRLRHSLPSPKCRLPATTTARHAACHAITASMQMVSNTIPR